MTTFDHQGKRPDQLETSYATFGICAVALIIMGFIAMILAFIQ